MTKVFCDICKKEIECDSEASEYKMKRLTHSFHESWWVRMTVHKDCWRALCKSICGGCGYTVSGDSQSGATRK